MFVSDRGLLDLNGVAIENNTGDANASAIDAQRKVRVTIKRSTISGNSLDGVKVSFDALLKIAESTFDGNAGAGATAVGATLVQIERSTFNANGTGVKVNAQRGSISTCTISGNGLGINTSSDPDGHPLSISNSTIAMNSGLGILTSPPGVVLKATIIAQNNLPGGPDCQSPLMSQGWNLVERVGFASCSYFPAPAVGDVTGLDPLLGPLQDNGGPTQTQALLAGSPALAAAAGSACNQKDQRGVKRKRPCDIGAFEAP